MSTGEDNFFSPAVLDRLIEKLKFKGDADLARFLGVPRQTVYSWRERGSVDLKIITTRCKDMDFNWLLKGSEARSAPESSRGSISVDDALHALYRHGHSVHLEPLGGGGPTPTT